MEAVTKSMVGIVVAAIVTTAGGVFAITRYMNEKQVNVLEQRLELAETKATDVQSLLDNMASNQSSVVPEELRANALNEPETKIVVDRVRELEKEKSDLIRQLSDSAVVSLDPDSEVRLLLQQLKKNVRTDETVSTLFNIASPVTFEPMVSYFLEHSKGESFVGGKIVPSWFDYFFSIDEIAGVRFAATQLQQYPDFAYSFLFHMVKSQRFCGEVKEELKQVALTSQVSEVRGKAKLLLQCGESSIETPGGQTHLKIYKIFSRHGLQSEFHQLVAASNEIYFWSTSSFLFSKIQSSGDNSYLNALKDITAEQMSNSSKALSYIFLQRAYEIMSMPAEAINAIESCDTEVPYMCADLIGEKK